MYSFLMCVNEDNPFLEEAITSVLQQDYQEFEFIIVANNCTDQLYKKLCEFEDSRIRLFRTSIGQLSFNLNFGIDKACGRYIIRMDSDDVCLPNRLSICKEYASSEYDLIAFSAELIDENNRCVGIRDLGRESVNRIIYKNPIIHPAVMLKKESLVRIRGYLGGYQSEDYDLWLRMIGKGYKIHFSKEVVLKYRIRNGQSKGSLLPYCEVAGYFLRELLLYKKLSLLAGLFIAIIKRFSR
ncbi:glycosyltransferase [Salinivibrio sp. ML323]|uniref:glycosyltransferase n=1 Tax=Salinivibrio sp. ML323 TaxID=1909474 RepID=UPI001054CBB8|nr:glycosyltransferase [Salinivibrio sp. ML323]